MDFDKLTEHYRTLLKKHGDSPEAVQYSSPESQERRFQILLDIGDLEGKKILDFGCGTGQLGAYLNRVCCKVDYSGVDIVPEFIDLCKSKFPMGRFGFIDDFSEMEFDYIFVSGVFNNKINDNITFYKESIKKLYSMAKIGVSFNMMSAYVDYKDENLFYEYPENVFKFIKSEVTPYVVLKNDYEVKKDVVPFDFTVYAYRMPN